MCIPVCGAGMVKPLLIECTNVCVGGSQTMRGLCVFSSEEEFCVSVR